MAKINIENEVRLKYNVHIYIDRVPGGVNIAGKETNFHVYGYIDYIVLYKESVVWHVLCGGCGQGEALKWSKK